MPEFTVLKQSEAPRRPTTPSLLRFRMAEYEGYVASLKKGQAGKLVPGEGESVRAVAVRVSRAAKRIARLVEVWTVDGAVYFRLQP